MQHEEINFKSLFYDNFSIMLLIDPVSGNIKDANESACQYYGWSHSELCSKNISEINTLSEQAIKDELINAVREERNHFFFKHRLANGELRDVEVIASPMKSGISQPLFSIIHDITERKRTEQALRESEARFRQLADSTFEAIVIHEKGILLDVNSSFCKMFGYSRPEVIGKPVMEMIAPEWKEQVLENIRTGYDKSYENGVVKKDGTIVMLETLGKPIEYQGRHVRVTAMRDITERKQAENALRESQSRLVLAATSAQIGIWDWDIVNNEMIWDDQMFRLYGISEKPASYGVEIWKSGLHPDDISYAWDACQAAINGEKKYDIEFRVKQPDGTTKFIKADGIVLRDENGKAIRMLGVNRDITKPKLAEQAIEASEKRYRGLLSNMDVGVIVHQADTSIAMSNPRAAELLGLSEEQMQGKVAMDPQWKFLDRNNNPLPLNGYPVNRVLISKKPMRSQFLGVVRPVTNDIVWLAVNGFPVLNHAGEIVEILISFIDVTEHTKMEKELVKVQKLDALGLLAGGIAHDFNNLTGGIFGYIDMASEESKDSKVSSYLSKAMNTIDRARALTQQLLTFAKGGAPIQQIGNLFPLIQETAQFALSGSNVSFHFDVPKDLWVCNFDKNQIGQVIDNIVINAKQAMSDGGSIELSARNISFAEKEHSTLTNGDYVKISIKDCGIGIPIEILPRIFDPFYTTKSTGHGLCLATCYSIIKRHGGCIEVESEPGKGSTFHIFLSAASKDSSLSSLESSATTHKGNGTFLVMDDEEVMRETIGSMLESLGYIVVYKENGSAALDFVAAEFKAKRKIAGMIFDLTIPGGMGGEEAIMKIRKYDLITPAFVTSGYAEDPVMANPNEHGFMASICKPFRKSELSEMLNKHMKVKK
jgi:PAS domain S-box-containing protein